MPYGLRAPSRGLLQILELADTAPSSPSYHVHILPHGIRFLKNEVGLKQSIFFDKIIRILLQILKQNTKIFASIVDTKPKIVNFS